MDSGKYLQFWPVILGMALACAWAIGCADNSRDTPFNDDDSTTTFAEKNTGDAEAVRDSEKIRKQELTALISQFSQGAKMLRNTLSANERLCSALFDLRTKCPILLPIIPAYKKPIVCASNKNQKVLLLIEARFRSSLDESMHLYLRTSESSYKAALEPKMAHHLLDFTAKDGSRNSKERLIDVQEMSIAGKVKNMKPSNNSRDPHLNLTLGHPDQILPYPGNLAPGRYSHLKTQRYDRPDHSNGGNSLYSYKYNDFLKEIRNWQNDDACQPDINAILQTQKTLDPAPPTAPADT